MCFTRISSVNTLFLLLISGILHFHFSAIFQVFTYKGVKQCSLRAFKLHLQEIGYLLVYLLLFHRYCMVIATVSIVNMSASMVCS